jgi:hypothetical protein
MEGEEMAASPVQQKVPETVSWRKKWRQQLMNTAFIMFWIGFPFAYYGGVRNQQGLIVVSFALFFLAGCVPLVTKK